MFRIDLSPTLLKVSTSFWKKLKELYVFNKWAQFFTDWTQGSNVSFNISLYKFDLRDNAAMSLLKIGSLFYMHLLTSGFIHMEHGGVLVHRRFIFKLWRIKFRLGRSRKIIFFCFVSFSGPTPFTISYLRFNTMQKIYVKTYSIDSKIFHLIY